MLLVFDKWVEKTKHKEILPRFEKVKNFNLKHYKAILVAFIVILPLQYMDIHIQKITIT